MDLTHPAFTVLGENRARILHRLAVLAEPVSGRRIHELSGVKSLRTVQRILDDLVRAGLVSVRRVGPANAYTLNREHILWDPIEGVLAGAARAVTGIADILTENVGHLARAAFLYGSMARGDGDAESDIDILIVWDDSVSGVETAELLDNAAKRIERLTGNRAQLLSLTERELSRLVERQDPLVESFRSDARPLTDGADIKTLLKGAEA